MGQEGVVRLLVNGQYIPRVKLNEYVYVNYESTSQDFFFLTILLFHQHCRESQLLLFLLISRRKEGRLWYVKCFFFNMYVMTVDSLEKPLMLGKIAGRRRRGCQRTRWVAGWHR